MSITALSGPVISFGAGVYSDYNPEEGPSLFWGGSGTLDPRPTLTYSPGQNFGNPTCGWLGVNKIMTLNIVPTTKSTTLIAAAANTVANTPMVLASANATGISVGVNGPLYNGQTTSSLVNALCLDPLVASVTASVSASTNLMTVSAVGAGGGVGYNRLCIGMVLSGTSIPTGTYIAAFGTGCGGVGTYILSQNATAAISSATITGLFTGVLTSGVAGAGATSGGTLPTLPFGSAGTVQLYNPAAMCSRAVSITSTTSQLDAATFTVVGADIYGQSMTEVITTSGTSATTTNGKKAFKFIQSVTPNSTDGTGSYSVGTTDIIGLPIRSDQFTALVGTEWDISIYWNSVGITSGTGYTAAVTTTPATATTGDVRGTYAVQVATNGTLRMIVTQSPGPAHFGVGTLGTGLFGVTQYATL